MKKKVPDRRHSKPCLLKCEFFFIPTFHWLGFHQQRYWETSSLADYFCPLSMPTLSLAACISAWLSSPIPKFLLSFSLTSSVSLSLSISLSLSLSLSLAYLPFCLSAFFLDFSFNLTLCLITSVSLLVIYQRTYLSVERLSFSSSYRSIRSLK